jgi:O-antigen/teichoic acid export membrane protein
MTVDALDAEVEISGSSAERVVSSAALPKHVAKTLVTGASALGMSVVLERGLGFLANLLAARLGGASVFGAYSLALTTANSVTTYAAGGIGSTAVRFGGKYPRETAGYRTLSKALTIISLTSALLAAFALWAGAKPIARLLGNESLTGLLSWAALSAAGMILLECCRGFLVGIRRLPALVMLSSFVGIGMLCLLPVASRRGSVPMVCAQAAITICAVLVCVALYRPLGLAPTQQGREPGSLGPMLREVWSFGLVQLAGLVGMNIAGWWLVSLVARSDASMVQMGFFAVANQLRNIVALAPTLLTESSLAVMAQRERDVEKTPDHVMAVCTFATMFASLLLAGVVIILAPWVLALLYGKSYASASSAAAVALAIAVVHMGSGPAAARLSIVSIKTTGVVNTIWAVLVAGAATIFLFHGGNAWKGMLIYLAAHVISAVLVFASLRRRNCIPRGMLSVYVLGLGGSLCLAALALARALQPQLAIQLTVSLLVVQTVVLVSLYRAGKRHSWVPRVEAVLSLLNIRGRFARTAITVSTDGGFDA